MEKKKLNLNKKVIAELSEDQMNNLVGGVNTAPTSVECESESHCDSYVCELKSIPPWCN